MDQPPSVKSKGLGEGGVQEPVSDVPMNASPPAVKAAKKRPASYLDEVLAARSSIQRKKREQAQQAGTAK